jgi:hypothetical protein
MTTRMMRRVILCSLKPMTKLKGQAKLIKRTFPSKLRIMKSSTLMTRISLINTK